MSELPEVIEQDLFGGKEKVKPKSCVNCRHSWVSCGIPRGIDAEHVEAIGLRCDSWEADE